MNVALTRAVDGFARRAFTVNEVLRMIDAGVIGRDEKFELIEGEIVPVSPRHDPHERVKSGLILWMASRLPGDLWLGVESSIYLAERTFVEPDLSIFARSLKLKEVRGPNLLLVIEVAEFEPCLRSRGQGAAVCELWRAGTVGGRRRNAGDDRSCRADRRRLGEHS